jgi:CheY-like chemotaxis protein
MKILYVEDNDDNVYMLKNRLSRAGFTVVVATNAMAGDKKRALAAGCDDFDTKPVDMPRLLDKIAALKPH